MFFKNLMNKIDGASSCHGKVKYGHYDTAVTAANKMEQKKQEKFEAYKCRHCEGYHIGHPRRNWGISVEVSK